ncbi:MAG: LiaF domain-containing protein, partial [Actinomycetota bacterium]
IASLVGLIIAILLFVDIDFDGGATVAFTPAGIEDLPATVDEDAGEVVIDLTELDAEMFDGSDGPETIDVELDFGEIRVVVPDDLPVDIEARTSVGEIQLFDRTDDGINNRITQTESDPDLALDLNVGFGSIVIERP